MVMRVDPKERDPRYKDLIKKADKEAEKFLEGKRPVRGQLGYCHFFWGTKQKILKEKYDVDWKTPAEINPWVLFD